MGVSTYSDQENQRIREHLHGLLVKNQWSQAQLAQKLGTSQQNLSGVLRGAYGATRATVAGLARLLGVTEAEVLGGSAGATLGGLPGWPEISERARVLFPAPESVYDVVSRLPAGSIPELTETNLGMLVQLWRASATETARDDAEQVYRARKVQTEKSARKSELMQREEEGTAVRRTDYDRPAPKQSSRGAKPTKKVGRPLVWASKKSG